MDDPGHQDEGKERQGATAHGPADCRILAILASLPRFYGGEYLFSTTSGESPVWVSDKVKRRLDSAMLEKLKEGADPGK